ncbi:MAG: polyribonucleotide nucleotidyltransferase, partial [Thermoleophilia bacterium]|nr:polyribonucleotide nucleotidyltransferase [Thermoleophilia bacterium]
VEALELAHSVVKTVCAAQIDLQSKVGKPKWYSTAVDAELDAKHGGLFDRLISEHGIAGVDKAQAEAFAAECPPVTADATEDVMVRRTQVKFALGFIADRRRAAAVKGPVHDQFGDAIKALSDAEQDSKELKSAKRSALIERIVSEIKLPFPSGSDHGLDSATTGAVKAAIDSVYKQIVRTKIAVDKRRPDGRGENEIRPISVSVGTVPRTHGSAIFTRGQTQALTLVTLGTMKEEQRIDDLSLENTKRYIHHYNFPPFSVGETGFMRGPKRRDIGHGALAERALLPVIPSGEDFPYTLRLVSETLESNGSSSMASVCGSTLALLDAGVHITRPVAGIAMGLIKEGDDHIVLTDIQGDEDHLGDMDFKVAGTSEGVTALQMDIKINGVTTEIMAQALKQAKDARLAILGIINEAMPGPREELSPWAPRITAIKIDPDKIGMVIGKGGETIRGLEADFEVEISIEDDGTVSVYGVQGEKADQCVERIRSMTKDVEVGDTYTGAKVVKTTTFGAFVELAKGVDGLLHISNLGSGRVEKVEDVINRGDSVDVVVEEVDRARGRIGLRLLNDDSAPAASGEPGGTEGTEGAEGDAERRPRRRRKVSTDDLAE